MYDDLVKRLREIHPEEFGDAWDFAFACQQAMCEAADAMEDMNRTMDTLEADNDSLCEQLDDMNEKWIPVTERLPALGVSVLTYCPAILYIEIQSLKKHVGNLHWENHHGDWQDWEAVDLWMPLPEPPKEGT